MFEIAVAVPLEVDLILTTLINNGYEAYIVGGCVRDSFLGRQPKDWDITTNATPDIILKLFTDYKIIKTGLKHGTVTIVVNKKSYEVTTYRIDGEYEDNRHPKSVEFTSTLYDDLARRDFTINALIADFHGNIKDYFTGKEDLNNKIIKTVGDPYCRFNEDGLRILRALRFASVLGFGIEEKTSEAIHQLKELLLNISQERITEEFNKLICGVNAKKILTDYRDVIAVFIPEIIPTFDFDQKSNYHKNNIYNHLVAVTDNYKGDDLIIKLACFLHDIGKPKCYTEDVTETGQIKGHFYGHPVICKKMVNNILTKMKYSNDIINKVTLLVEYHDIEFTCTDKNIKKLLNKFDGSVDMLFKLLDLKNADREDHNGINIPIDKIAVNKKIKTILGKKDSFSLKTLAINGNDLLQLGITPSPLMGIILNNCLMNVIDCKLKNKKNILIKYVNQILKDKSILK